jgi:hypothetical protein
VPDGPAEAFEPGSGSSSPTDSVSLATIALRSSSVIEKTTGSAAVAGATSGRASLLASDLSLCLGPHLPHESLKLNPQWFVMMNTMTLTKALNSFLDQRVMGLVVGTPVRPKVPEVIAKQDVRPRVAGALSQVVDKIFRTMVRRPLPPSESAPALLIDAIAALRESLCHVVLSVACLIGYASDVEQSVVRMK